MDKVDYASDLRYYPEKQKCLCCRKVKSRESFLTSFTNDLGEVRKKLSYICRRCRFPSSNLGKDE